MILHTATCLQELYEFVEEVFRIRRARGRFRMELNGKEGKLFVFDPFDSFIISIFKSGEEGFHLYSAAKARQGAGPRA